MNPRAASRTIAPQAAASEPAPAAAAEHIYIASEEVGDPSKIAGTVRSTFVLTNPLHRDRAQVTLYKEGVLQVARARNGAAAARFFLDLRYLDPVPTIERVIAVRCLYAAMGCGATAAMAAFLLRFDALHTGATAVLAAATLLGLGALCLVLRRSHERTEFCTLHGRATVLQLVARLGSINRVRGFVPTLSRAIEEAAELIGADTAAYLRAEMREHYRLRSDGVLDNDECAAATGRILAQFDVQL
jgi:hypothetical protein